MSTGITSFANLDQLGPIYPMVGAEWLLFFIGFVIWIVWHIWQIAIEKYEHKEELKRWGDKEGLKQALELEEDPSSRHFKR